MNKLMLYLFPNSVACFVGRLLFLFEETEKKETNMNH